MIITRRSLLTGMIASALIVPVAKIVRATELVEPEKYLFTSSWYEQLERGLWRQQCYHFNAITAPRLLVVNASPDAKEIAGVQLDWDWAWASRGGTVPQLTNSLGWVRGTVDVKNNNGPEIELTRDEEQRLMETGRRATDIIRPEPSDLFGLSRDEGSFA